MRFKVSLVQLLLATTVVAAVCFAMTNPNSFTGVVVVSGTVVVLLTLLARAVVAGSKSSVRHRIGLALSIGYLTIAVGFSRHFSSLLITDVALDCAYSLVRSNAPPDLALMPNDDPLDYFVEKVQFTMIGHCVFTMLLIATPFLASVVIEQKPAKDAEAIEI